MKRQFTSNIKVDKQSKKRGIVITANIDHSKQDHQSCSPDFRYKIKNSHVNQLKKHRVKYNHLKTLCSSTSICMVDAGRCERCALSSVEDDAYKATKGKIKPAKHLLLGIALKSLTGSKKDNELLNHIGHCISYTSCV